MKEVLVLDTGKEWGGGTNSLIELLKRIDKKRYHFTVLFYDNYKKGTVSDVKTVVENLVVNFLLLDRRRQSLSVKILKEIGRSLLFINKKTRNRYLFWVDYKFRIQPDAERIVKILKKLKVDLLYMNNQPSSNHEGILAAHMAGIPSIQHSRIVTELNPFEVDTVNRCLTLMICVSKGVRDSFVGQGIKPSKCEVVYNGIDPSLRPNIAASDIRGRWKIKKDELLIGFVGSLIKRKRVDDLIKGLAALQKKKDRDIKCIVVGDGPEKESLQRLVKKKGLQEKVIFAGFQNYAISYINAMDILVLPSEKEGLPRVVLEAMLMAKPAVAYDITGPSELIINGKTGFLVPLGNIKMLTDAVSRLINSDDTRKDMGRKGRRRVMELFSIDSSVTGVDKIFNEVLG